MKIEFRSYYLTSLFKKKLRVVLLAITFIVLESHDILAEAEKITLEAGASKHFSFEESMTEVGVADPTIADVGLSSSTSLYVLGKRLGTTEVSVKSDYKELKKIVVEVVQNLSQLQQLIARIDPTKAVKVSPFADGVILSGTVTSPAVAEEILSLAAHFLGDNKKVFNRLSISKPPQVLLKVRIAEVSRSFITDIGLNWDGLGTKNNSMYALLTGRSATTSATSIGQAAQNFGLPVMNNFGYLAARAGNVNFILDLLERRNLATTLAEPNLTALSGETASFLAGGEYPIPVPGTTTNSTTITYKQYGVRLSFTPTVLSGNQISLQVEPEVSQPDPANSIELNGIKVPALITRRASTTVELGSGQSFAIAGLIQYKAAKSLSALPGFSEVPILGALFQSKSFQSEENELIIIVTPYLASPGKENKEIKIEEDKVPVYATEVERLLKKNFNKEAMEQGKSLRLMGTAGFIF